MRINRSDLIKLIFLGFMLVGAGFVHSGEQYLPLGFLLFFLAFLGIIVLKFGENSLPLSTEGREGWRLVLAVGRRRFLFGQVRRGLFGGLLFLLYEVSKSFWLGKSLSADWGIVLVCLAVTLYIGGTYYSASRLWALNESRYKDSI